MRRQQSACSKFWIAGAEEARGRIMRWLSVLPWPPPGLAAGFGRGFALPTPEPGSEVELTPMQEMGPRLVPLSAGTTRRHPAPAPGGEPDDRPDAGDRRDVIDP